MTDVGWRQPAAKQALHACPRHIAGLATATQRAMPAPFYLLTKGLQCGAIAWHTVIAEMATHYRSQPLPLLL
jgi:hypothetical protein